MWSCPDDVTSYVHMLCSLRPINYFALSTKLEYGITDSAPENQWLMFYRETDSTYCGRHLEQTPLAPSMPARHSDSKATAVSSSSSSTSVASLSLSCWYGQCRWCLLQTLPTISLEWLKLRARYTVRLLAQVVARLFVCIAKAKQMLSFVTGRCHPCFRCLVTL